MSDLYAGVIDKYKIYYSKVIGKGQFGTVYECLNTETLERLCVKVIPSNLQSEREIEVLEKIKQHPHQHLITVYDIKNESDLDYIFMKKYPQNLEQLIDQKKNANQLFPLSQVLNFIKQLIIGYKQLYQLDQVHRDLKPANILVGHNGELIIADFGSAKVKCDENVEQSRVGTLQYSSYQQSVTGIYTSKADVYSLGVLVYYIIFYRPIFVATAGQFSQMLRENLQNTRMIIPAILNEGTEQERNEIVEFLKLTITFEEKDRINWPDLFKWFIEGQPRMHKQLQRISHCNSEINLPRVYQLEQSNVSTSLIQFSYMWQERENNGRLVKKTSNAFWKFVEVIFAKAELGQAILNILQEIKLTSNVDLQIRTEILQIHLNCYLYSLILNAYSIGFNQENYNQIQAYKQFKFSEETINQYHQSREDVIKNQQQKLFDLIRRQYDRIKHIENHIIQLKKTKFQQPDINKTLKEFNFEEKLFYNYDNFFEKYLTNYKKFIIQWWLINQNQNHNILRLKAYSIKISDKSCCYPLKNYNTIDLQDMVTLNNDEKQLSEFVNLYEL